MSSSAPTECFNLGQCFIQEKRRRWGRFLYMLLRLPNHYSKNFRTLAIKWMHRFDYSIKNVIDLTSNFHLATRCDSSIMKLSGDIHFIRNEHQQLEKTIQELMSSLQTVSKNLDMKVTEKFWNSYVLLLEVRASQMALVVKNWPTNSGDIRDAGSILGMGRSPREGNGNPLQCSCLENPTDRGVWQAMVHRVTNEVT